MKYQELADKAGCSYSTVASLLSGRRNAGMKLAIKLKRIIPETGLLQWCFAIDHFKHLAKKVKSA